MRTSPARAASALILLVLVASGCYALRGHSGGGAAPPDVPAGERRLEPADVALPPGYRIEVVAAGFTFPTSVVFDAAGVPHVVEAGYSYGEVFTTPRLLRVGEGGAAVPVAEGTRNGPWTGAVFHRDAFYVAEGGYGWPEHAAGDPIAGERYAAPGEAPVRRLLAAMPGAPPRPAAVFAVNSSANGLDFARGERFGHAGEAFVALFGDMNPTTGKLLAPVGFKVVRVDPATGVIADFAANRGERGGPASVLGSGGLERPVAARFDPSGEALYVVDFGVLSLDDGRPTPRPGTGVLWRIVRSGASP